MSKRMEGVSQTSIRNIEGLNAQRETHGLDVSLRTALEICTVLWPDVHIQDFCGLDRQSLLRLVPLNQKAKKEIASLQAII